MCFSPRMWRCFLVVAALATVQPAIQATGAEQAEPVLTRRVADSSTDWYDARTEIEALRTRLAALEGADAGQHAGDGGGCCGCDCGCCDPCCRSEGWLAGAELVWLKPHNNNGVGLPGFLAAQAQADDAQIDADFEASPRFWLGYSRCDGVGYRVRYWEFDHENSAELETPFLGTTTVFHDWDTWVLDAEITKSTRLGCDVDATFSFGFRYVDYEEGTGLVDGGGPFTTRHNFDGSGLTMACEWRIPVSCAWGVFVNSRASAIYGDEDYRANGDGAGQVLQLDQEDVVKFIYEIQTGVEYTVPICGGGYYFARAIVEAQYWDGFGADHSGNLINAFALAGAPTPVLPDGASGFFGFGFSVGMAR